MSDDKPTREQLAAAAQHDPNNCTAGCRDVRHGDQASTEDEREIDRLRLELAKVKADLEATEKLKNELVYAANGGPSRELAIVTLGEALKANGELRAELARVQKMVRHFLESDSVEGIHVLWEQRLRSVLKPEEPKAVS